MLVGLAFFGILVGFSSGFLALVVQTILVPALIYLGYDIKMAIGISVMQMIFSSMFGSYVNYKAGVLQLNSGIFRIWGSFWRGTERVYHQSITANSAFNSFCRHFSNVYLQVFYSPRCSQRRSQ